jgi:uncharacterized protein (TIGR00255 family)
MIRSMTGFGRASGAVGDRYQVTVTAKSVNHRYLEVSVRLPEFFWELESNVRAIGAEVFGRGKLDVTIRAQRTSDPDWDVRIDHHIAKAVIPKITTLVEQFGLHRMNAGDLLRIPDLLNVEAIEQELDEAEKEAFLGVVREAFGKLASMRAAEGEALEGELRALLGAIRVQRDALEAQRESMVRELLQSYRERVAEIASKAGVDLLDDRLAQETVILAEKADVAEELQRMSSHLDQMDALLGAKEAAGKKLDFLCQETLREINTLGSKSRSAPVRTAVVELKSLVERIREQVQNVE